MAGGNSQGLGTQEGGFINGMWVLSASHVAAVRYAERRGIKNSSRHSQLFRRSEYGEAKDSKSPVALEIPSDSTNMRWREGCKNSIGLRLMWSPIHVA